MGLLTEYSSANMVVQSDTAVTYSYKRIPCNYEYADGTQIVTVSECYEYHRYKTKQYSFVGMTKAAAAECAADLASYYYRTFWTSTFSSDEKTFIEDEVGKMMMADVSTVKTAGNMYQVDIAVHEDDVKYSIELLPPASLFVSESGRGYTY